MSTTTTNYALIKPGVNDPTDQDLWGGYLNDDLDSIDSLMLTATNDLVNAQTGSYSVVVGDRNKLVTIDASGAVATVGLPVAATAGDGFRVTIKKIDSSSNSVTIDGSGAETIDGAANVVITNQWTAFTLVCNGTSWAIASKYSKSGLTQREYFRVDGTHTTKSTTVRVYVAGAGGGGGADNDGSAGGNSTCTDGVTLVTANGGAGGKAAFSESTAPAHGTCTNGDLNLTGGGSVGGVAAWQTSGSFGGPGTDGANGGYAVKDYTVAIGATLTIVVGLKGTAGAGGGTSQDGVDGYVIVEW